MRKCEDSYMPMLFVFKSVYSCTTVCKYAHCIVYLQHGGRRHLTYRPFGVILFPCLRHWLSLPKMSHNYAASQCAAVVARR